MSKSEKILIVLVMGSIWGALELFGGDLFRSLGTPHMTSYLFALGLIILYAAKRLGGFAGSVVIMALICGLFKTASTNFYACQFAAVMINGIIFDISYQRFKDQMDSSPIYRAIAAPIIAYVSYAIFVLAVTYVINEPNWAARGMAGVKGYILVDGTFAAVASIITINIGYYLGNALRPLFAERKIGLPVGVFRAVSLVVVAAIWIAGQLY